MWNKNNYISKFQPLVDKLINKLQTIGISTKKDYLDENYIFTKDNKELRISFHSLYRYSGLSHVLKDGKEKNSVVEHYITDEVWINNYIQVSILMYFEN